MFVFIIFIYKDEIKMFKTKCKNPTLHIIKNSLSNKRDISSILILYISNKRQDFVRSS